MYRTKRDRRAACTYAEAATVATRRTTTARDAEDTISTIPALVAILLAHLDARLGFEFFDADGYETNDVGVDAHAAFHLGDGGRGSIDVEERIVRLAVLLDLESEVLETPVFLLGDLALAFFDDALE